MRLSSWAALIWSVLVLGVAGTTVLGVRLQKDQEIRALMDENEDLVRQFGVCSEKVSEFADETTKWRKMNQRVFALYKRQLLYMGLDDWYLSHNAKPEDLELPLNPCRWRPKAVGCGPYKEGEDVPIYIGVLKTTK